MRYSAVRFKSNGITDWQQDLLIADLAEIGFDTFEDTSAGFDAYIPTSNLSMAALETVLLNHVDGYLLDHEVEELAVLNWYLLWERNFNSITVDVLCHVRATF